jgi:hypothetical protein
MDPLLHAARPNSVNRAAKRVCVRSFELGVVRLGMGGL